MKCETIRPLLTRYLLSDLDEVTMKRVREHLKTCEACRAEAWEIKPTLEILRDALAAPTSAPKHLSGTRHQDIIHRPGTTGTKIDWWITRKQPVLSVAAAALIMVALVFALMIATPSMMKSRKSVVISILEPGPMEELEEIDEEMTAMGWEQTAAYHAKPARGYKIPRGGGAAAPVDVQIKDTGMDAGGAADDEFGADDFADETAMTYYRNVSPGKAGSAETVNYGVAVDQYVRTEPTYTATAKPKPSSGKKQDEWYELGLSGGGAGGDRNGKDRASGRAGKGVAGAGKLGKGGAKERGWPEGMNAVVDARDKDSKSRDHLRFRNGSGGLAASPQVATPVQPRLPAAPPPMKAQTLPLAEPPTAEEAPGRGELKPESWTRRARETHAKREEVEENKSRQLAWTGSGTRGDALYDYDAGSLEDSIGGEALQRGAEASGDKDSRKKFNLGDIPLIGRVFKGANASVSSTVAAEAPAEVAQVKVVKRKKKMALDGRRSLEKERLERFTEEAAPAADMPVAAGERGRRQADEGRYSDGNASWEVTSRRDGKPAANEQQKVVEDAKRLLRESRRELVVATELSLGGAVKGFSSSVELDPNSAPANGPGDASPAPAKFDDVSMVKSPAIVNGLYANRMPGAREKALEEYGANEAFKETSPQQQAFMFAIPGLDNAESDVSDVEEASRTDGAIIFEIPDLSSAEVNNLNGSVLTYAAEGEDIDGDEMRDLTDADHLVVFEKVAEDQVALSDREKDKSGPTFKAVGVNPFVEVDDNAFSTFGIDVDTASYTMMRNMVARGSLPAAESVRTEEFVNFFDYAYAPATHNTFRIYTEVAPSKFGRGLHMMKIGVKGRRLGREEQRQAALTFLIDTSGSMNQPDRLGLVKKSLAMLLKQLNPEDRVAVVQYDSHARLVIEHTPAAQLKEILEAIERMQTGGSTNLEEGMNKAYELAANNFVPGGENRVLLLSDGVANLGSGGADDILARVEGYRKQGVFCSVFGFGVGAYDDTMLETLANKGDGTYAFIDSMAEAKRVFVDDLSATLNTIAKDVKIQVEFKDDVVERYRQLGYENRQLTKEQFRDDSVDAGEVGSGQSVTALYELELGRAPGRRGVSLREDPVVAIVRVRYRRTDTGRVEEIEQPVKLSQVTRSFDEAETHFKLAACVAEYAEILRGCPHAVGSTFRDVSEVLTPVALDLTLDTRVQELLRMVNQANGLPRGE